mgnify:CR=1 FL=1
MFRYDLLTYLESYLTEERKQRFLEVLQKRTKHITVAVEDVYQLHNTSFSESLNVSVSAAIIIQQLAQKVRDSNLNWQLTDIEILNKQLDWTKKSIKDVQGIIKRYRSE